ncbi:MFS family permease [Kitasatospora sp. GP30]|uniref:MFS transporter n=1 Tax=Kitasatospora sp. GP30 TaxID=3035084 RepID=UPI000CAE475D|nr:MFS transporter [Kitasatospora sp. GP30]MDH6139822.1 MFS family permease [Kitasatospora sp. GP30]
MHAKNEGLLAQLRRPPGGRDARLMLTAQGVDRTGTGVWAAASVLYFTFVAHLDARQVGLLLGVAAVAGIAGSPIAGRLAERQPVRRLLMASHLLRLATVALMLVAHSFGALLALVAITSLGERSAKTLEMLFATQVAGEQRAVYQALFRSVANAGYAVGAGIAAIGLAIGTVDAYRALILFDALSFVAAALLVRLTSPVPGVSAHAAPADEPTQGPNPWRDRGYLLFVLLDIAMNLDDAVLNVGLPLWLIHHTRAPHAFVPAFLIINTVLVVVLQLRFSTWASRTARRPATSVALIGLAMLVCCALIALTTGARAWTAVIALSAAAVLTTLAELLRSISSWELAVSLAPTQARASYLGVAGMSQSIEKAAGPLLLTGAVFAGGPVGWLALGGALAGLGMVQRRVCLRRLGAMAGVTVGGPVAVKA